MSISTSSSNKMKKRKGKLARLVSVPRMRRLSAASAPRKLSMPLPNIKLPGLSKKKKEPENKTKNQHPAVEGKLRSKKDLSKSDKGRKRALSSLFFKSEEKQKQTDSQDSLFGLEDIEIITENPNMMPLPPKPLLCTQRKLDDSYMELSSIESDYDEEEEEENVNRNRNIGINKCTEQTTMLLDIDPDREQQLRERSVSNSMREKLKKCEEML